MADVLQRGPGEQPEVRVVRWCGAHDLVRAAILTSTQAIGSGRDKFSDLDIILVLRDIRPLSEHREWLSDFGDVLAAWRDTTALKHDPPRTCWVTQYVDGSKIDFTLWPIELLREMARSPGLPDQLDVGYRVLIDKDGITSALEPPVIAPTSQAVRPGRSISPSSKSSFSNRLTSRSTSGAAI